MKRILTVLFAMMLSVAVLAGCNKGTGADADKDAAAKTATKVTATAKTTAKKTEAATTKATKASKAAPAPTAEQFGDGRLIAEAGESGGRSLCVRAEVCDQLRGQQGPAGQHAQGLGIHER